MYEYVNPQIYDDINIYLSIYLFLIFICHMFMGKGI